MSENFQTISKTIVRRSMVDRAEQRLFCLGPNVGRISFLSQQIRALNLIWALYVEGKIFPNALVAVVGAGVSGITAAVALRAYNCTVHVYDQGGRPLHRQRETTHRHIYPNINWWPMEPELALTTSLPFLDWHFGQCNEVVQLLEQDWEKLSREHDDELKFIANVEITAAYPDRSYENRLVLKSNKDQHPGYDAVIVATGFGEEGEFLDLPNVSYWDGDRLESHRDGSQKKEQVIVSGFGDGGQIDALRLAYDFGFGKLAYKVAQLLTGSPLSDEISKVEEFSEDHKKWQAKAILYEEFADEIRDNDAYKDVKSVLENALKINTRFVIMVDKYATSPYEKAAAPIHKLLVAYAHRRSVIEYLTGELTPLGGDKKKGYALGEETFYCDETHFVVRHGAPSYAGKLILPSEWEALEKRQGESRKYSFMPAWLADGEPFVVPHGWPCPERDEENYISSRASLAQAAINRIGSLGLVMPSTDKFIVMNHNIEYRPSKLFGKSVEFKTLTEEKIAEYME